MLQTNAYDFQKSFQEASWLWLYRIPDSYLHWEPLVYDAMSLDELTWHLKYFPCFNINYIYINYMMILDDVWHGGGEFIGKQDPEPVIYEMY